MTRGDLVEMIALERDAADENEREAATLARLRRHVEALEARRRAEKAAAYALELEDELDRRFGG